MATLRQIASGLRAWLSPATPRWTSSWLASVGQTGLISPGAPRVTPESAAALSACYRACSFISDSLASIEFRVVQQLPDGGRKVIESSDAARALADWSFTQRETFIWNAALGGNGFAIIRRNGRDGALALDSTVPRRVGAAVDDEGTLFYLIEPYEQGQRPEVVPASSMVHLKFRAIGHAASRDTFAVPPAVSAAQSVGLVIAARDFQSALWARGARPIGALQTERKLNDDVIERIRNQWAEYYGGTEATGRTAILESGVKWAPVEPSVTPESAELVAYNKFGVEEIARLYGVPPSLLAQTGNASYSTAVEESRAVVLHCLRPWAARLSDCLGRALLKREDRLKGVRIEASLDHLLVAPGKETSEYLRELVNAGILSVNEARNLLGREDTTGGDIHRVQVNTMPLIGKPKEEATP
ncbi:MAG: phage portal protein [Burkholderiales bacterium]|nr:phage portal protein [Burkholderiales bacterium]